MLLRCLYMAVMMASAWVWSTPLQQGRPWILAPISSSFSTYSLVAPSGGYARLLTSLEAPLKDLTLSAWVNVTNFTDGVSPILTYVMPEASRQVSFFLRHDGLGVLWGGPRTDIVPYRGVLVDRRPRMHWNLEETEGFVEDAAGSARNKREAEDYSGGLGDIVDILDLGRRQGRQSNRWTPTSFVDIDKMGVTDLMAEASDLHLLPTRADYSRSESYNDWTNVPYELHMLESGGGDPYDQHLATQDSETQYQEPRIITRPTGNDGDFVIFNWNVPGMPKVRSHPLGENQWSPIWEEEPKLPDPTPSPTTAENSKRVDDVNDAIGGKWSSQVTEVRLGPNHWNPFTSVMSNSFTYVAPPQHSLQPHPPLSRVVLPPPSGGGVPSTHTHPSMPPSTRPTPISPTHSAPPLPHAVPLTLTSPPDSQPLTTPASTVPPSRPPRPPPRPKHHTQPPHLQSRTTLPPRTSKLRRTTHSPRITQSARTSLLTHPWPLRTTRAPRTTRPANPFVKVTMRDDTQTTVSQLPTSQPTTQTTSQPQTTPTTSTSTTTTMPRTQKSTTPKTEPIIITQPTTVTTTSTTPPPPTPPPPPPITTTTTTVPYSRYTTLRFTGPPRIHQSDHATVKSVVRQQTMRTPLWKRIKQPPMPKFTTNAPSTSTGTPKSRSTTKTSTSRNTKPTTTATTTSTTAQPPRPVYHHQRQQDLKPYVTEGKSKVSTWTASDRDEQKANKFKWADGVRDSLTSSPPKDLSVEITSDHMAQFMRVLSAPPTVTDGNKAVVYSIPITDEKAFYAMYQKYQQETMATMGPKFPQHESPSDTIKAEEETNVNQLGSTGANDNKDNTNANIVYFHSNENKFELDKNPGFSVVEDTTGIRKPASQPLPERNDISLSEEDTTSIHNHRVYSGYQEEVLTPTYNNKGYAQEGYTRLAVSQADEIPSRSQDENSFVAYNQGGVKAQEYSIEDEYKLVSHMQPGPSFPTDTQNNDARPMISYAGGSYSSYLQEASILPPYNQENIAAKYRLTDDEVLQFSHTTNNNPKLGTKDGDLPPHLFNDGKLWKYLSTEGQSPANNYKGESVPANSPKDVVHPFKTEDVDNNLPEVPVYAKEPILDKGIIISPSYNEESNGEPNDPAFSSPVTEGNNSFSPTLHKEHQSMLLSKLPSITIDDTQPSSEMIKVVLMDGEKQPLTFEIKKGEEEGEEMDLYEKQLERKGVEEEQEGVQEKNVALHKLYRNQNPSKPTVYELQHNTPKGQVPRAPSSTGSHSRPQVPLIPRTTTRTPGRPSLPFERAPNDANTPPLTPKQPTHTVKANNDNTRLPQQYNPAVAFSENLASLPPSHYQEVISLYHEEKPPTYLFPTAAPGETVPQPISYGEIPQETDRLEHDVPQIVYSDDKQTLVADGLLPHAIHTVSSRMEAQKWMHQQNENSFRAPSSNYHNVDQVFIEDLSQGINVSQQSKPEELLPLKTEAHDVPLSIHFKKVPYQFTPNEWFHVAFSWHSETRQMDVYVNGLLVGTLTETMLHAPHFPSGGLIILGQTLLPDLTQIDHTSNFIGEMSKVNIWPQALNQKAIRGMYQCTHYPATAKAMSWNDLSMRLYNGMHLKNLDSLCA